MTRKEAIDELKNKMVAGLEGVDGTNIIEAYSKAIEALESVDRTEEICEDLKRENEDLKERLKALEDCIC